MDNIKSIKELLELKFLIPSYQRGYRWDKQQIEDLLEDILEFSNLGGKQNGEFYCLQPIIVKEDKKNNSYQLIDGQQRLTTIYIILSYFDEVAKLLYGNNEKFAIEYETREDSKSFLEKIVTTNKKDESNIDYYHMSQAFLIIKEWFDKHSNIKVDFFNTLIKHNIDKDEKDISNNVRVIWYEIDEKENEIEVFTRINSGKIPLTNAELIKALFLNSKNFEDNEKSIRQIEISKEWDEMEYALQNDEFWYFLTKNKNYSTRIELIFEVFANIKLKDRYDTYRYFAQQKDIVKLWSENNESIKKVFLSLKYWFDNRKLYHLIGFLISEEVETVQSIYYDFKEKTKKEFQEDLYTKIKKLIRLHDIEKLEYGKNSSEIKQVLLLFNIATILNNKESYIRFSFDRFNNENWSLEHIHAQNEKSLSNHDSQKEWLETTKKYITNCMEKDSKNGRKKLITDIEKALKSHEIENFDTLQDEIFDMFGMSDIHTIDNLALLSTKNNTSLSNNIFPIKRDIIIEMDKKGAFIPICTKNVFLKFYSKDISKLYFWQQTDRDEYLSEMKRVLTKFLGDENE
jgi:uncharacterized protein with ParB-like and HNH nuclease domain